MNKLSKIAITASLLTLILSIFIACYEHRQREKAERITTLGQKTVAQASKVIEQYIAMNNQTRLGASIDKNINQERYKNGMAISNGLVDTVTAALNIARKQIREISQTAISLRNEKLHAQKRKDSLQYLVYYYEDKYLKSNYGLAYANGDENMKYKMLDIK